MRQLLSLAVLVFLCMPVRAQEGSAPAPEAAKPSKPYLETIFTDPAHPQLSAGVTFNSKFTFTGGVTMVAPVYHRGDPDNSLIPKKLQDMGLKPISWGLNIGVGGAEGNFVVPFGFSANLTPTVLGPALKAMRASGNSTAQGIASIIDSPAGGVAFGPAWTAYPMRDGVVRPLNEWSFPPGWFVGGLWKF